MQTKIENNSAMEEVRLNSEICWPLGSTTTSPIQLVGKPISQPVSAHSHCRNSRALSKGLERSTTSLSQRRKDLTQSAHHASHCKSQSRGKEGQGDKEEGWLTRSKTRRQPLTQRRHDGEKHSNLPNSFVGGPPPPESKTSVLG